MKGVVYWLHEKFAMSLTYVKRIASFTSWLIHHFATAIFNNYLFKLILQLGALIYEKVSFCIKLREL